MREKNRTAVGVFLLLGVMLFGFGLFLIGDRRKLFSETIELMAEYGDVAGLKNGSIVRVAGMDAGEVRRVEAPPSPDQEFRVYFSVVEKLQPIVRKDSVATIETDGIVGNQYLQVNPGTVDSPQAKDGDTIRSEEPFEFADLVAQARVTIDSAQGLVERVGDDAEEIVDRLASIAKEADDIVKQTGPEVEAVAANARRISDDASVVMAKIEAGEGLAGKILTDDKLAEDVKGALSSMRKTAEDVEATGEELRLLLAEVRKSEVVENVDATIANVKETTAQVKELVAELKPPKGESSMVAEARETMTFARETMEDFSENSEALKRNFLLRGFFKKRGFYDLDEISVEDYKRGEEAPGYETDRVWLAAQNLYETGDDGKTRLSAEGKERIQEAVAPFLDSIRDNPFLVEGYAAAGDEAAQYVVSHNRAALVRDFLVKEFLLRPTYVGTMPMGRVESRDGSGAWRGVALVRFQPDADKETRKELKNRDTPRP